LLASYAADGKTHGFTSKYALTNLAVNSEWDVFGLYAGAGLSRGIGKMGGLAVGGEGLFPGAFRVAGGEPGGFGVPAPTVVTPSPLLTGAVYGAGAVANTATCTTWASVSWC
jgi:hypothetical protein